MIIESIRQFIKGCPYIQQFHEATGSGIEHIDESVSCYFIEEVSVEPILKRYVDGASKRQCAFIFRSMESYTDDVIQNIKSSGFYENFTKWLEEQSNKGELPILDGNKQSIKIETIKTAEALETGVDKACYRIQCRLIYFQGGM